MTSTKDVLDHHLKSFSEGDLGGILSDYAPEAILFTRDGPLKGADAMRPRSSRSAVSGSLNAVAIGAPSAAQKS